jgi:hypothetical protein
MIFYLLSKAFKLKWLSSWKGINKQSFIVIFGTLIWSIVWQLVKGYTGDNVVMKAINSGFYYLVLADIFIFFANGQDLFQEKQNYPISYLYDPPVEAYTQDTTGTYVTEISDAIDDKQFDVIDDISKIDKDETSVVGSDKIGTAVATEKIAPLP